MRLASFTAIVLVLASLLAGCTNPNVQPAVEVAFETVAHGHDSFVEGQETLVARDQAELEAALARLEAVYLDEGEEPLDLDDLDLSDRMLIGVFGGSRPNSCHGAVIDTMTGYPGNATLVVEGRWFEVVDPATSCLAETVQPFHLVTAPAGNTTVDVVFQMEDAAVDSFPEPWGAQDAPPPANGTSQDDPDDQGDGTTPEEEGNRTQSNTTRAVSTLDQGQTSSIAERQEIAVTTQTGWRSLWANHTEGQNDPPPRPEVNFSHRMVLAIFKGQSPDGCHGAEISNVTAQNGSLVVEGAYIKQEGGACTQQVTYPFHIVETEAFDGPIDWRIEEETRQA